MEGAKAMAAGIQKAPVRIISAAGWTAVSTHDLLFVILSYCDVNRIEQAKNFGLSANE